MFATVWTCVGFALALNRVVFGKRSEFELGTREAWRNAYATLKA
jgi:SSS family solute:Na+ symporter